MSFLSELKQWARGEDEYEEEEEETLDLPTAKRRELPTAREESFTPPVTDFKRRDKVVSINATTQLSVVLVKPEKFDNAAEIADHLREKRTVVLNLEQTNKDVARRLIDFLSGVTYAQDGKISKVANSTFILTPYNVNILGDLLDQLENNGLYI